MRRRLPALVLTCTAAGAFAGWMLSSALGSEISQSRATNSSTKAVARRSAECPRDLLPLTANAIGPSVTAALIADLPKNRPQVIGAEVASNDTRRGLQVKELCGARAWHRTIVVYITDRAFLPSQSLAERVLLVGRTSSGYRIWNRVH